MQSRYFFPFLVLLEAEPAASQAQVAVDHPQCTTIEECARFAMEAAFEAKIALQVAVPIGAVMAFNLPECPAGWAPFSELNGRVIVGAGAGEGLTARPWKEKKGVETHKLTVPEMPSHTHTNGNFVHLLQRTGHHTTTGLDGSPVEPDIAHVAEMMAAGGSQAHENMQPFYVLTYCERRQ